MYGCKKIIKSCCISDKLYYYIAILHVQREIEKTYRSFDNLQVISTPGTGEVKMSITSKKVDELKNNIDVLILQIDNVQSKTEKSNIISHLKAGLRLITEDDSNSQQLNIKVTKNTLFNSSPRLKGSLQNRIIL